MRGGGGPSVERKVNKIEGRDQSKTRCVVSKSIKRERERERGE